MKPKLVILSGNGQYVEFIYNGLQPAFPVAAVFIEEDPPPAVVLKKRRRKIGLINTAGQQLFGKYIIPKLQQKARARVRALIKEAHLNPSKIPDDKLFPVPSVNDAATIDRLLDIKPDIIIVNSTRLLGKKFLQSIQVPIINIHGGITPGYRGMAGAYWALANGEPEKCGSTIHLIDAGIDTGAALCQQTITVGQEDNYLTYAFLQLPHEIEMLKKVLPALAAGTAQPLALVGPSRVWHEPTIWQYWYNALVKKVK